MHSSFNRQRALPLMVTLVAAALGAPAAQAFHAPADHSTTTPQPQWKASQLEVDRLGPKFVPLQHSLPPAPVTVVKIVGHGGFDWDDGAIGAGVSGLALATVAGLALLVTRRNSDSRKPGARLSLPDEA
jgi:hypothetical protein